MSYESSSNYNEQVIKDLEASLEAERITKRILRDTYEQLESKLKFKEKEYLSMENKYSETYDKYREELKRGLDWKEKAEVQHEKLIVAVEALTECHQVMTESWPDRNITIVTGEVLEKIKQ